MVAEIDMAKTPSVLNRDGLRSISSASSLLECCLGDVEQIDLPIDLEKIFSCIEGVRFSNSLNIDDLLKSGYVRVERKADKSVHNILIWVNPTEVLQRQRFTAAHELGHLIHDVFPSIEDDAVNEEISDELVWHRGEKRSYRETRADRFAAQLLMPAKLIKREVKKLLECSSESREKITVQNAIDVLAEKFNVSKQAMEIRLKTLGYTK